MFDKWLRYPIHEPLHFLGCALVVVGLPLNKVVMSIGTIWLIANVLIEANFESYWNNIKKHKIGWFIVAFFLLHLVGMAWSEDWTYGLKDMRTKLPWIALPVALIARPLEKPYRKYILIVFLISLGITSAINTYQLISGRVSELGDIRYLSRFGSHIRYNLLVVFGIAIGFYFSFFQKKKSLVFLGWIALIWFMYYLIITGVASALLALLGVGIVLFIFLLKLVQNRFVRFGMIVLFLSSTLLLGSKAIAFFSESNHSINQADLATFSSQGNLYFHDLENPMMENGNHIMSFIVEEELRTCWNQKSMLDYDGLDKKGQHLKATLIRYLTSLGERKDAEGCAKLSLADVQHIENGITSINVVNGGLSARLDDFKTEMYNYRMGNSPGGNSLLQRLEYWKVARYIIKQNFWFGVGTGDVQRAFDDGFLAIESPLEVDYQNRAHNQFLTTWLTFGVFGFLLFIVMWYLLLHNAMVSWNFLGLAFISIVLLSFFPEDTLETQQGVTFVGFFLGFIPWYEKGRWL